MTAVNGKRMCAVSYESFSSCTLRTFKIHPLTLFEHNGGLYAFVFQPYHEKVIILAVERIRSIQISGERFEAPENFNAERILRDPFGIVLNEESFVARIRFDADQAPYIQERDWPEGTEIEESGDGSILLSIVTAGEYELKKWILGFGPSAEVLEPDWLRDDVIDTVRKISERYSG